MNCVELHESLAEGNSVRDLEQKAHLKSCPTCSELVRELDLIVEAAGQLQSSDGPSPRVWNSIEIVLRKEGLIHPPGSDRSLSSRNWAVARWLAPAAAVLILTLGIYLRYQLQPRESDQQASNAVSTISPVGLNDEDFIQEVAGTAPAMKMQYVENLRRVNDSIRDAQDLVEESPNDAEARRLLMDAYEQKSMLFEMAMDRSLP
jgi:hypothetical protein